MNKISNPLIIGGNSHSSFKSLSKRISLFIIGVGSLVLVGWALDIAALKSIVPGLASMKSNTALLFILSGISLWMQVRGHAHRIAQIGALIVAFVGLLTLGEYLANRDFGIDQLLLRDATIGVLDPGRMAPATALCFLLIGLALIFLDNQSGNWFNKSFVIATFSISLLALIGYIYGVSSLYQIGVYTSMALHTALSFILLSTAILFARPEQGLMQTILADTPGGNILRRLLPVAIVTPVLLGWIRLAGQRAGLYDTAFGLALMVTSLIATLTIFIWFNARQLTTIDIKREELDSSLQASELRLHSSLADMMEGCQILGYDWRYLYINKTAEKHNRRPNSELLGNVYMDMWPGIEATAVFPLLRRCMEERTPQRMLNEFTYPNGSLGWFELNIQPVPDGIFILSGDVTDRKRAEQALLEREMKLSMLFEILPVGVSILDAEHKVSYSNPALKKILDISEQELLKGTYQDLKYLRADGTLMPVEEYTSVRAFKEKREIDDVEMGVVKEDGCIIWTNVSAVPVDFPDWKLVIVISDITERKQAEEYLHTNERRLHLAASAGKVGIWDWDVVKDELIWDESMYSLYSIHKRDFSGAYHAWTSTLHPDDRQFTEGEIQAALRGEREYAPEFRIVRPDGVVRVIKATSQTIRDQDGKALRMIGTNIDITERKQAEEALKESEVKFSAAFHSSPVALVISTLEGKFVETNRAFCELIGYSNEEIIGNTAVKLELLSASDRERIVAVLKDTGGSVSNFEIQFRIRDGSLRDILYSLTNISFRGESHRLSTGVDITERKQAEREILKLNAELEGKVIERTAELAAANEHLHELSIVDELTGLYNRRGFLLHAEQQLLLARRTKRNLLIFYADLDGLKQINDQLGHIAGDKAIAVAAGLLREAFRTSDIKARLGGDEFAVLVVEAEEHDAQILITRLRERLTENNQSMSVGVVAFDAQHDISIDDLIARADQAMYIEKRKKPGRLLITTQ